MFFFMWPLRFIITFLIFFFVARGIMRLVRGITGNDDGFMKRRFMTMNRKMFNPFAPAESVDNAGPEAPELRDSSRFESRVFKLADEHRGRITLSDVVLSTGRGMKESETMLEKMVDGNHVRMEVDDRGIVFYEFPEIIRKYEVGNGGT